ncbi:MAG: formylmethanofuran dehydrogenase subunit C [Phycisphaera sp.]|nr:formylmethanofuran dehydrogenase subunit C [Phycisphaera sp.]
MNGYTLTWKSTHSPSPGDGAFLRPDILTGLVPNQLSQYPVRVGRHTVGLGQLFDITGKPGDTLHVKAMPPLPMIGREMASGTLVIEGNAGDDLGASMKGGLIAVIGHARHRVGGPSPTQNRGMTGGEIVIHGNAGDHAGTRMRRGLIVIGGDCGHAPGYQMGAGTIVVGQQIASDPGLSMRRGTILALGKLPELHAHLADAGLFDPSALPAISMTLRRANHLLQTIPDSVTKLQLFTGDRFELSRGEVIQCLY